MIDAALCIAIQSMPSFQSKGRVTLNDVYAEVSEARDYPRSHVLHSLIGAALSECGDPDGLYNQPCLSADKPTPSIVPTSPDNNQARALRQYLASPSLNMCN